MYAYVHVQGLFLQDFKCSSNGICKEALHRLSIVIQLASFNSLLTDLTEKIYKTQYI